MTLVVVRSKIKELAEFEGRKFSVATDFADALDEKIEEMVKKACWRAKQNSRTTIMPRDI